MKKVSNKILKMGLSKKIKKIHKIIKFIKMRRIKLMKMRKMLMKKKVMSK